MGDWGLDGVGVVFGVGGSSVFVCLAFSGRAAAPAVWRLGRSGTVPVLLKGRAKGGRVTLQSVAGGGELVLPGMGGGHGDLDPAHAES